MKMFSPIYLENVAEKNMTFVSDYGIIRKNKRRESKMNSFIMQETAKTALDLLRRVDDGYVLTDDELWNLEKISVANFSGLEIEKLPESIDKLSQLTRLDVTENHLTSLPESIGALSQLTELNISRNHLTSLPESIGALSHLTELDISRNQLTSLPESIGALSRLTELNASFNELTGLPENIEELSQLVELVLFSN